MAQAIPKSPPDAPSGLNYSIVMDFLFALALASLFSGIEGNIGFTNIHPFEFIAVICLLGTASRHDLRFPSVLLPAVLFLVNHVVSATAYGAVNGVREILQLFVTVGYMISLWTYYRREDITRMINYFAVMIVCIVAFTVVWHIAHGQFVGWKLLDNAKSSFLALPVLVSGWLAKRRDKLDLTSLVVIIGCGLIILLSAERKAYLAAIFGLLFGAGLLNKRMLVVVACLVAVVAAVLLFTDAQGSLSIHIMSLLSPTQGIPNLGAITRVYVSQGYVPESFSNMQRLFSLAAGWGFFTTSPFFGIGTNAYVDLVQIKFGYLPPWMTIGIHDEFFRVLVENGIVGEVFYLFIWIAAFRNLVAIGSFREWPKPLRGADRTRVIMFVACLMYCAFESSKTLSLLSIQLALMPQLFIPKARRQRYVLNLKVARDREASGLAPQGTG
jgi:hypothetical protein